MPTRKRRTRTAGGHRPSGLAELLVARKQRWRPRTYLDHVRHSTPGGGATSAGSGKTKPSVLHALLVLPLAQIDADTIKAWAKQATQRRATVTRYGNRMMRAFINGGALGCIDAIEADTVARSVIGLKHDRVAVGNASYLALNWLCIHWPQEADENEGGLPREFRRVGHPAYKGGYMPR